MKSIFTLSAAVVCLASSLVLPLRADDTEPGFVDLGSFTPPKGRGQFVEVNVKEHLIALAARLTEKSEPEVADLLRGLKSVRVNVLGLDEINRSQLDARLRKIRAELDAKGWEKVVVMQDGDEQVGVYLKHRGEEAIEGILVTVIDGDKEAVLVNVVGDISPEKLATIGERLNIEPLKKVAGKVKKS